jgi:hypothetical protein
MLTMLLAMTTGPERHEPPDEKREITENDGIWCYGYNFFFVGITATRSIVNISVGSMVYSKVRKNKRAHL